MKPELVVDGATWKSSKSSSVNSLSQSEHGDHEGMHTIK